MNAAWSTFLGATRYEFRMQIRRKAVWIAMGATIAFMFGWTRQLWGYQSGIPASRMMGNWALSCNHYLPIVFGVLLADRLPRDRRLGVNELFDSTAAAPGGRLAGKYLGSTLATATPIFLFYLTGVTTTLAHSNDPMVIPLALAAFVAIILPGLLFVAAFSIAVPAILWVPLYQFLFVGYWFWGNMFAPEYGIPTLSNTFLTPIGGEAAAGFFGTYPLFNDRLLGGMPMAWQGTVSVTALLVCAMAALFAVFRYRAWERACT